ncbi:hypothetical protein O2K51_07390 [Apibacter raozihei]|uniref:hypothetical protein n=1 Tax=Apibacter raozihei TaxID=2500547 RepID=UPI000FE2A196|nr:hypothetical protein [Apibacter raozihei]
MKFIFTTLILSFFMVLSAQEELVYKIPRDASIVIHAKGNKFLEHISLEDFNKTRMGGVLLNQFFKKEKEDKDIRDTGIDFSADMYFYQQINDSIIFNCYLVSLDNALKFDRLIQQKEDINKKIKLNNGSKEFYESGQYLIWDTKKLLLVYGELNDEYLRKDTIIAKRYGLTEKSSYDFYYPEDSIVLKKYDYNEDFSDIAVAADSAIVSSDNYDRYSDVDTIAVHSEYDEQTDDDDFEDSPVEYDNYEEREYYDEKAYDKYQASQDSIKNEILKNWMYSYGESIFRRTKAQPSIMENEEYRKSIDKDAAVTYFVNMSRPWSLLQSNKFIYSKLYYYYNISLLTNVLSKNVSGSLNMDKNAIRLKYNFELYDKDVEMYKQLYNHKLNKKFYKYIDSDEVVGYMSSAINTQKLLELYPKFMARIYGEVFKENKDEINLFAELFSLFLDEKSVAEVIKGDALFLLKGFTAKEHSYKTYDYDEDYNATEVEKVKTYNVPDFLFMASSDNPRIIYSILNYGIKKGTVNVEDGIYHIHHTNIEPVSFYMFIKENENIVFVGSSKDELLKIKTNTFKANLDKKDKINLTSNKFNFNFKPYRLVGKLPKSGFDNIEEFIKMRNLFGAMGEINGKDEGVKGNSVVGEYNFSTTEEDKNSLKYFLKLSEMLTDM